MDTNKIEYAEFVKEMRTNEDRLKRMLIDDRVKVFDWGHILDKNNIQGADRERFLKAQEYVNNIKIRCENGVWS